MTVFLEQEPTGAAGSEPKLLLPSATVNVNIEPETEIDPLEKHRSNNISVIEHNNAASERLGRGMRRKRPKENTTLLPEGDILPIKDELEEATKAPREHKGAIRSKKRSLDEISEECAPENSFIAQSLSGHVGLTLETAVVNAHVESHKREVRPQESDNNLAGKKKKIAHGKETISILKNWLLSAEHVSNPYPTEEEKKELMELTGLDKKQLTNWFTNARKRIWQPKYGPTPKSKRGTSANMSTANSYPHAPAPSHHLHIQHMRAHPNAPARGSTHTPRADEAKTSPSPLPLLTDADTSNEDEDQEVKMTLKGTRHTNANFCYPHARYHPPQAVRPLPLPQHSNTTHPHTQHSPHCTPSISSNRVITSHQHQPLEGHTPMTMAPGTNNPSPPSNTNTLPVDDLSRPPPLSIPLISYSNDPFLAPLSPVSPLEMEKFDFQFDDAFSNPGQTNSFISARH